MITASTPLLRSENFVDLLERWIAIGLAFQIGLVLWPIGNYSPLLYFFLFLPTLIVMAAFPRKVWAVVCEADPPMRLAFGFLLVWLPITSLWGNSGPVIPTALEAARFNLLVLSFVVAIAYLRHYAAAQLRQALVAGLLLASLLALCTFVNELLNGSILDSRLEAFGFGDRLTLLNPVPAGIYFGGLSALGVMLIWWIRLPLAVRLVLAAGVALCVVLMLLTGTRAALLALWLTLCVVLLRSGRYRLAALGVGGLPLILLGLGFAFQEELSLFARPEGLGSWRPQFWLESLRSSWEHKLMGAGFLQEITFVAQQERAGELQVHQQNHSHSFYLHLLWWSGLPALIAYLVLLGRALYRASTGWNVPMNRIAGGILVYFCCVQLFDVYNVFNRPSYYWPWIWLPLGLLISGQLLRHESAPEGSQN